MKRKEEGGQRDKGRKGGEKVRGVGGEGERRREKKVQLN